MTSELNEGVFAQYAERLWAASHGGPSTAEAFQQAYDDPGDGVGRPAPRPPEDPAGTFFRPSRCYRGAAWRWRRCASKCRIA